MTHIMFFMSENQYKPSNMIYISKSYGILNFPTFRLLKDEPQIILKYIFAYQIRSFLTK